MRKKFADFFAKSLKIASATPPHRPTETKNCAEVKQLEQQSNNMNDCVGRSNNWNNNQTT